METSTESESTLSCKVKDVTAFIKQHVQTIRKEVILKNKALYKLERENKLIKLRQGRIPSSANQNPSGRPLVTDLLPEVLPCLYERHQIFYLEGSDIKNLRLVSKEWRLAIDKYFVRRCSNTTYGYFHVPLPKILLNDKNVNRLLKLFPSSAPMPYSLQSVIVDLNVNCPVKYSKPQFLKATQVLQNIGKSVQDFTWKTDIERHQEFPSAVVWNNRLRSWLNSMPNLTAIELLFKVDFWSKSEYKTFSTKLEEQLAINPFPNLEKLAILKVAYNVPHILLCSALQQNPTIKVLRASAEYPLENAQKQVLGSLWNGFSNLQLNNLTELHIKDYDKYIEYTRGSEFDTNMLKTVNWPLKTLTFEFVGKSQHDFANRNLYYLFSIANNFEKTLTKLRISHAGWTPSTDGSNLQLKLPHLEDLFLAVEFHPKVKSNTVHMYVDFDFILELPLLKLFGLHLYEYVDTAFKHEYLEEAIQLQGYFKCLYESQIWAILPALQSVKLSTRCQYEKSYDSSYNYNRNDYKSFLLSSKML